MTHICLDIKNVDLRNFALHHVRNTSISVTQCTTFSGVAGDCNSSLFEVSDITFEDVIGTVNGNPVASFQCSKSAPCRNFTLENINLTLPNGTEASGWNCNNLGGTTGFNCTGSACDHGTPDGTC